MSTTSPKLRDTWGTRREVVMRDVLRRVPPNFFAIPFGLAGLGVVWRAMAASYGAPAAMPDALLALAASVWLLLVVCLIARSPRQVAADISDSVLSPFLALVFIVPIVIAGGIATDAPSLAKGLFIAAVIPAALIGGWLTGQWIAGDVDEAKAHPGYFLPTVAGGFLAAQVASHVGLRSVGMLCFGVGMVCWFVLGSVVLSRLLFRTSLPAPLVPTLANWVGAGLTPAPPTPPDVRVRIRRFARHPGSGGRVRRTLAGHGWSSRRWAGRSRGPRSPRSASIPCVRTPIVGRSAR